MDTKKISKDTINGTVLGTFEIFSNLPLSVREDIASRLSLRTVNKGQFVISKTRDSTEVYFIVSGEIRVCTFGKNGKQVFYDVLKPGKMFGELSAIDNHSRSSDCIALTEASLAVMDRADFLYVMKNHDDILDKVLLRLVGLVRNTMQQVYEFSSMTVNERIRCEILRLISVEGGTENDIVLRSVPTHAELAVRVSTQREAVTRELKKMESSGVLTWKPGEYVIHDVVKLMEPIG